MLLVVDPWLIAWLHHCWQLSCGGCDGLFVAGKYSQFLQLLRVHWRWFSSYILWISFFDVLREVACFCNCKLQHILIILQVSVLHYAENLVKMCEELIMIWHVLTYFLFRCNNVSWNEVKWNVYAWCNKVLQLHCVWWSKAGVIWDMKFSQLWILIFGPVGCGAV